MADSGDELTVVEAIARLRTAGYTGDASAVPGGVRCSVCGTQHRVEDLVVDEILRVEGPSDPSDEALVAGLRCPGCGNRSVLVAGYGPGASAEDQDVVLALRSG
jgi:hypothetical protein